MAFVKIASLLLLACLLQIEATPFGQHHGPGRRPTASPTPAPSNTTSSLVASVNVTTLVYSGVNKTLVLQEDIYVNISASGSGNHSRHVDIPSLTSSIAGKIASMKSNGVSSSNSLLSSSDSSSSVADVKNGLSLAFNLTDTVVLSVATGYKPATTITIVVDVDVYTAGNSTAGNSTVV